MRHTYSLNNIPDSGTAVALGNFDGVHLGHAKVIGTARTFNSELLPSVLMFSPHPQMVLSGSAPCELITESLKKAALEKAGAKAVFYIDFNKIKDMSGDEFVEDVLKNKLKAKAVCCGYNYRFSRGGKLGITELSEICKRCSIKFKFADEVDFDGEPISSTRIRKAVEQGDMELAHAMLGRPFSYDFEVRTGDMRGRTLGSPTINQHFPDGFVVPRFGVYASQTFAQGKWYASVTNFGMRPTFGTDKPRSETYIIGFYDNLYGKHIKVGLLKYLRPEIKFSSANKLIAMISKNTEEAKKIFGVMKDEEY